MRNNRTAVALAGFLLFAGLAGVVLPHFDFIWQWCGDQIMLSCGGPEAVPVLEIRHDEDVYEAILDDQSIDVYAIYCYTPGTGEYKQKRTLALLNGFFGGSVRIISVDVSQYSPPEYLSHSLQHKHKEVPYVEIHLVSRTPVTGTIQSSSHELIAAPSGFTTLRLELQKFLSRKSANGNFGIVSEGRAHVPGWDFYTSAFPVIKEGRGRVESIVPVAGFACPTAAVKLEGDPRWFGVDKHSGQNIDDIRIGDQVSYDYSIYSDSRAVYGDEPVSREQVLASASDRPATLVGVRQFMTERLKEGHGRVVRVANLIDFTPPIRAIRLDNDPRWFADDTACCQEIEAIKIGDQVSVQYLVFNGFEPRQIAKLRGLSVLPVISDNVTSVCR